MFKCKTCGGTGLINPAGSGSVGGCPDCTGNISWYVILAGLFVVAMVIFAVVMV